MTGNSPPPPAPSTPAGRPAGKRWVDWWQEITIAALVVAIVAVIILPPKKSAEPERLETFQPGNSLSGDANTQDQELKPDTPGPLSALVEKSKHDDSAPPPEPAPFKGVRVPHGFIESLGSPFRSSSGKLKIGRELWLTVQEEDAVSEANQRARKDAATGRTTQMDSTVIKENEKLRLPALDEAALQTLKDEFANGLPNSLRPDTRKILQFLFDRDIDREFGGELVLWLENTSTSSLRSLRMPGRLGEFVMKVTYPDGETKTMAQGFKFDYLRYDDSLLKPAR